MLNRFGGTAYWRPTTSRISRRNQCICFFIRVVCQTLAQVARARVRHEKSTHAAPSNTTKGTQATFVRLPNFVPSSRLTELLTWYRGITAAVRASSDKAFLIWSLLHSLDDSNALTPITVSTSSAVATCYGVAASHRQTSVQGPPLQNQLALGGSG